MTHTIFLVAYWPVVAAAFAPLVRLYIKSGAQAADEQDN